MYDLPQMRPANNRFWQAIRAQLKQAPQQLTHDADPWQVWQSPDLLFAQTCGYPYRARLHGQVQLIGTPDYGLPDCPPGHYNSVFITHADTPAQTPEDLAQGTFAFNEPLSQSGWAAPMTHLGQQARFRHYLQTGAHAASARAVAQGQADLAAIDALTWALLRTHDPITRTLREIGRTAPTPGLPYITSPRQNAQHLAQAVRRAILQLSAPDRATLHLQGLVSIPAQAYLAIPTPAAPPDP